MIPTTSWQTVAPTAKRKVKENIAYFQTLCGHTSDALKILKEYMETNPAVMDQFCGRWGLDKQAFLKSLFVTVYFHDIGKLTKEFQGNITNGKHSQWYPHAYYALFILERVNLPNLLEVQIEKAAILGHHTQLHSQLYTMDEAFHKPTFLLGEIEEFIRNAKRFHSELGFNRWFPLEELSLAPLPEPRKFWGFLRSFRDYLKNNTDSAEDKEKLKSIYSYLFSILKTCDYYSSAEFSNFIEGYGGQEAVFDSVMTEPEKYVPQVDVTNPHEKILGKLTPYEYQKDEKGTICGDVPFYSLLFAPCGRGKTETALIWAAKAMQKYNRNKIVFAMPTQITSNAMWERFCELFGEGTEKKERINSGKKHVGLFHGKSFIKLKAEKKRETEEDELDLEEIQGENFKGNVFFKPVTVTTIDHLLCSFIHGFSQADFALGNLQNSVIIFDEVHYYAKETLEHLITLFGLLKKMGVPHLLMSGTLPDFFIDKVREINMEYQGPYKDEEGLKFEPFKIALSNRKLVGKDWINEDVIGEILDNYGKGLVQFVILNTVDRSRLVYETLIDRLHMKEAAPKIFLHHSQFVYRDREEKENELIKALREEKARPFILVATQVIEISLDVSCDVMYTELAPADAIGQRGGRLNRKGITWNSNGFEHTMNIFTPEEMETEDSKNRPYDRNLLNKTKGSLDEGICTYEKLKQVCDSVYSGYELTTPTSFRRIFKDCCLFGYSPYDINFGDEETGKQIQIRVEEVPQIEVIPWRYYGDNEINLSAENLAKVPLWWYKQDEKEHGEPYCFKRITKKVGSREKYYWVTTIPYSKEKGFEFNTPMDFPSPPAFG